MWCFIGDGETDEPETLGSISLAAREGLDNLIWVVNCNLQRLDGPVRGNGKIIQELEAVFRGAGWNVIKVIWGRQWDELLRNDHHGVLLAKMNATVDGEFQRYATEDGAYIREHFFGPDPRLRELVEHLSDDELRALPRGGHDYGKLYAAYKAATEQVGAPTVILAKTVKGWTLGAEVEGRNATHQIKKLTNVQLRALRERLYLHDEIPEEALADDKEPPYFKPAARQPRDALPARAAPGPRRLAPPPGRAHEATAGDAVGRRRSTSSTSGSGKQEVSTTTAFTRLLRNLCRDGEFGKRVVPIIPDEARTFGMDALFKELGIYASGGQRYEPVDHNLLLSLHGEEGRPDPRGGHHRGRARWRRGSRRRRRTPPAACPWCRSSPSIRCSASSGWATSSGRPPTPAHAASCCGATAGRTTLLGEGLQHQDGHSLAAGVDGAGVRGLRPRLRLRDGGDHPARHRADVRPPTPRRRRLLLPDPLQRDLRHAGAARGRERRRHLPRHVPLGRRRRTDSKHCGPRSCSPARRRARRARRPTSCADQHGVGCELWSATSYKRLREEALAVRALEPAASRRRAPGAAGDRAARRSRRARSSPSPTSCGRCPTRSAGGSRGRGPRSAPTASGAATPARRCGGSSRSTPPTSSSPCWRRWPRPATSSPRRC